MTYPFAVPEVLLLLLVSSGPAASAAPPSAPRASSAPAAFPAKAETEKTDRSWLLKPDVFARLSSGGRRLALAWNGLSPARLTGRTSAAKTSKVTAPGGPPLPRENVRVNDPALDEVGHTNSESSIAVRSGRIVVGFDDAARNVAAWAISADGGATFRHQRLPGPPDGYTYGDPSVAFGPGGEIYYATLMTTGGDSVSTIGVAKSTDGGLTFGAPVDVASSISNSASAQDKDGLAVDTSPSSPHRGNVYVAWTYLASPGQTFIVFARSRDGGQTFDPSIHLSPADFYGVGNATIAVGPGGEVYVAFEDGHILPDGISILKSTDGGVSFTGPFGVAAFNGLRILTGGGGVRASSYPSLAVDASGRVHLAFAVTKSTATSDRADIVYSRSVNGGVNWSAPVTLNDDATPTTQAFPWIAAAADGIIGVKWADRRNDAHLDGLTDVYMTISPDGGATWGKNFRITETNWVYGPVDTATVPRSYHGEYDGLAADGGNFYLSWSDERGSDPDVYFAWVPAAFDAATPEANVSAVTEYGAVPQGQAALFDVVTAGANGFSAPLVLSAGPAIPGLTYAFSAPTVAPGGTSRLTVSATTGVAPGNYHLTVTATGGGITRATTIWLSVVPASRPVPLPSNVTATAGFTGSGGVVADGAGRLHLVYEDDTAAVRGEDVFYRRSLDGGVTWSLPVKLNSTGSFGVDTVLAADAAGHVVAVWVGGALTDTTTRVYAARSSDGGATFSAPAVLTPTNQHAVYPMAALDRSGNALVVYVEDGSIWNYVYTTRATPGGVFDTPLSIPEQNAATITRPGLAYDSKGVAYLAYTRQVLDQTGGIASTVRFAIGKDGRNFASPVDLTNAGDANAFAPHVALGADDSVLLAYYALLATPSGDPNREVMLIRSADGGATFSAPVNVSRNPGQSVFPSVVAESGGGIDVVWEDDLGGAGSDILVARSTDFGRTFSAPMNVSADLGLSGGAANPLESIGGSGRAAATVRGGGTLFLSWLDDSAANPDVFLVAADPGSLMNLPPTASITSPAPGVTVEAAVPLSFTGSGSDPEGGALTFTWGFGDGTAATGASPPAHLFSGPGTFVVTLTVTDPAGLSAQASVSVTVTVPSASGASLLLPVVVDSPGSKGSHYVSEVTLVSRAASPVEVVLAYTASLGSGTGFARLTLGTGEMRVLPDMLSFLRSRNLPIPSDGSRQAGTLLATFGGVADSSAVFAGARTFTPDPAGGAGTFGLFYAAARATPGPATLFGLRQDAGERANVAIANGGSDTITLRVALLGARGEDLGSLPDRTLPPWGWYQFDQPLAGLASSGRAVVTRVAGTSPFAAYAVLNDAVTSDGSFLPPLLEDDASGADRLVPVVVDTAGQGPGVRFRTELTLANLTSAPLPLTLVYSAAAGFGSGSGSATLTLDPFEQRIVPDAIALLRASLLIESDGRNVGGSLLVRAPTGTPASSLAVGARTFTTAAGGGTFGVFYPGLTLAESADGPVWVYALQQNGSQRSNVAVVNRGDAGDAVTLRISYFGADGAFLGVTVVETLAPGQWKQYNHPVSDFGVGSWTGYVRIERLSGASRFAAYGVLNDNVSADGSYVPMNH